MRTHYISPVADLRDTASEATADVRSLLYYDVRLVIDSVSAERDAYAAVEIALLKDGRSVLSTASRIQGTGQSHIGVGRHDIAGLTVRTRTDMKGLMRLSYRIVSFDRYEGVPKVI